MNLIQNFIKKLFRIQPAREREIVIIEPHTFLADVIRNKLWYRGDSAELEQYFKKTARWDVEKARFWAATAQGKVRKMHSGIVSTVVDRYRDIVLADLDAVTFGEGQEALNELWTEIFEKADLNNVIGEAISGVLASGDGAFKITADECSPYPIVEFYDVEMWIMYLSTLSSKKLNFIQATSPAARIFGWKRYMGAAISATSSMMNMDMRHP